MVALGGGPGPAGEEAPLAPQGKRRKVARSGRPKASAVGAGAPEEASEAAEGCRRRRPLVCGPLWVRTLRGELLGRRLALVCCGEAHEDAIDLTRKQGVVEAKLGWTEEDPHLRECGWAAGRATSTRSGLDLKQARLWAARLLRAREGKGYEVDGACLLFQDGTARLFPPDSKRDPACRLPAGAVVLRWADLDSQARLFNRRRLAGEDIAPEEHDRLIAERKNARLEEGMELFDDWLLRHLAAESEGRGAPRVELVLEAPVRAGEVELHVEPGVAPAPPAHACLRALELDSEPGSDSEKDPDDGTGTFIDYLCRRVCAPPDVVDRVWRVDPRELGDPDNERDRGEFRALLAETQPEDAELLELKALGAAAATGAGRGAAAPARAEGRRRRDGPAPPPSWEAFFGSASELLYHSPDVKADFAPFLAGCVGGAAALRAFFEALYFRTVPEAVAELRLNDATRAFSRVRSYVHCCEPSPGRSDPSDRPALQRRPGDHELVPVKAAPLDRYLKARGSAPPRTWISGVADGLRRAGLAEVVDASREWYLEAVEQLLHDPKGADLQGDYFAAWLRECHRDIYRDIDHSDPQEMRSLQWAASLGGGGRRHNVGELRVPGLEAAWSDLAAFDPSAGRSSSRRQRALAKILVDIFQVRLVDLAMILAVARCAASAPEGEPLVLVVYAGGDHAKVVADFWQGRGLSPEGLPEDGRVGKERWEDDEPRGLAFPEYLHDLGCLFVEREPLRSASG